MWWWWVGVSLVLWAARPMEGAADAGAAGPSTILIEAQTGQSLREHNADAKVLSSSLNQLMVLLLSLEEAGMDALPLDARVTVSAAPAAGRAAVMPRLTLRSDRTYILSDLLKAMLLTAAPEAATASAEAIAGSAPACVELMNARAQRLGMATTHYNSIDGDPHANAADADTTTARDLARLAQALLQHAQVVEWASLNGLPFDQGAILLRNVNQLLGAVPGVDGLHVSSIGSGRVAAHSIVATARRGALRLIAVVTAAATSTERYRSAAELLEWGFAQYERLEIVRQDEALNFPIRVVHGAVSQLIPVAGKTFSLLRRRDEERDLQLRYQLPVVLAAPLKRHQQIGEIIVEENGELIAVVPVLSPAKVRAAGLLAAAVP